MLDYRGADTSKAEPAPAPRVASTMTRVNVDDIYRAALRHKLSIVLFALLGALAGYIATKTMTPRYVATAQIYLDPRGLPGLEKDTVGQDSTGYINFVETQARLLTSQVVLDRVVAAEKLDADPEFVGDAPGLMSRLFPKAALAEQDDNALAASRTLAKLVQVRRPERTFIIEISATSRSAAKAARIANAVAQAYIDTRASMVGDAAQQATASFSARLENLRSRLIAAEKQVEDYKIANGLVGARNEYVDEQSLKEINQQLSLARTRADEARTKYEQIRRARNSDAELASLVALLNVPVLTNLRGQQTAALERVAELSADLGPRHPAVRNASARAAEVRRLIDAELLRVAGSIRKEYEQARDLEAELRGDVDKLRGRAAETAQASVKLRDLEREVEVSRTVYESFLSRSRNAAEAQPLDPTSTHIVTRATPPAFRTFPPGAALMSGGGMALGLGCGLLFALWREKGSGGAAISPASRRAAKLDSAGGTAVDADRPEPLRARISDATAFDILYPARFDDPLEINRMGVPVIASKAGNSELAAVSRILAKLLERERLKTVAVVGAADKEARTIVAVNLASDLARLGVRTALIDVDRDGVLSSLIDRQNDALGDLEGYLETSTEGVIVALPDRADDAAFAASSAMLFDDLRNGDFGLKLMLCDGAPLNADSVDWTILVTDKRNAEDAVMTRLPAQIAERILFVVQFDHPDPWDDAALDMTSDSAPEIDQRNVA